MPDGGFHALKQQLEFAETFRVSFTAAWPVRPYLSQQPPILSMPIMVTLCPYLGMLTTLLRSFVRSAHENSRALLSVIVCLSDRR
jgi:hypothetical protein